MPSVLKRQKSILSGSKTPRNNHPTNALCSYCLIYLQDQDNPVAHPLWPMERMCRRCADHFVKCHICERKAVPWTVVDDNGKLFKYKVQSFSANGLVGRLSGAATKAEARTKARYLCGRCSGVSAILTDEDVSREAIFVLEFIFLEFGIFFSPYMLRNNRGAEAAFGSKLFMTKAPSPDKFERASDYEDWLRSHVKRVIQVLPIRLSRQAMPDGVQAFTDTISDGKSSRIQEISFGGGLVRPKLWALMVHELVHAYIHLNRDHKYIHTSSKGFGCQNELEEGLANTASVFMLKKVQNDICATLNVPLSNVEYGYTGPVMLCELLGEDNDREHYGITINRHFQPDTIAKLLPKNKDIAYDPLYQEGVLVSYLIRREKNREDNSYGKSMRRCMKVIDRRIKGHTDLNPTEIFHDVILEFCETGHVKGT